MTLQSFNTNGRVNTLFINDLYANFLYLQKMISYQGCNKVGLVFFYLYIKQFFYKLRALFCTKEPYSFVVIQFFMTRFENETNKNLEYFLKTWVRYWYDLLTIFSAKKSNFDDSVSYLIEGFPIVKIIIAEEN